MTADDAARTQREAVAGYLSSRNWGNRHTRMGGPRGFWLAEADALLAALSAIAPVQPDPLNSQSGSNLEFAGSSQPDPLRAGVAEGRPETTVREEVCETVLPALGSPICLVHHNGERTFGRLVQIGWHAKTKAWTFTVSTQDVTP